MAAHFDGAKSTADDPGPQTEQPNGNEHAWERMMALFQTAPPLKTRNSNHVEAGPSGTQNSPRLSQEEEEASLRAARARFERLIVQNDRQEEVASERSKIPYVAEGQKPLQEAISANARKPTDDTLKSLSRSTTGVIEKRPSFQTALAVIGSNGTRKRPDSTCAVQSESPPKKRRDSGGYTAIQGEERPQKVRFGTTEVLKPNKPSYSNTFRGISSTAIASPNDLDYETKLGILQDMRLASAATSATVLFESNGNLGRAVERLGGQMNTGHCSSNNGAQSPRAPPPRSSIRIQSPRASPSRSSIRIQSSEAVPAQLKSGPEIDEKVATLRDMGFSNPTFILVRALHLCNGSVEAAVEALLAGGPRSPPPQGVEDIDLALLQRDEKSPPQAYKGKGKGKAPVPEEPQQPPTELSHTMIADPVAHYQQRLRELSAEVFGVPNQDSWRPITPANFRSAVAGQRRGPETPSLLATTGGTNLLALEELRRQWEPQAEIARQSNTAAGWNVLTPEDMRRQYERETEIAGQSTTTSRSNIPPPKEIRKHYEQEAEIARQSRASGVNQLIPGLGQHDYASANTNAATLDHHARRLQAAARPGSVRDVEALRVQREWLERAKQNQRKMDKETKEKERRERGASVQARHSGFRGCAGLDGGEDEDIFAMELDDVNGPPILATKQVGDEGTDEDAEGEVDDTGDVVMGEQ